MKCSEATHSFIYTEVSRRKDSHIFVVYGCSLRNENVQQHAATLMFQLVKQTRQEEEHQQQ